LISSAGDNSVGVWEYDKEKDIMLQVDCLKSVNNSHYFSSLLLLKNINCIAAGSDNGFITIWMELQQNDSNTKKTRKCLYCWSAHKGIVTNLKYFPKYNLLLSAATDGVVHLTYLCDPRNNPPMLLPVNKIGKKIWNDHELKNDMDVNNNGNAQTNIGKNEKYNKENEIIPNVMTQKFDKYLKEEVEKMQHLDN